ncbi:MAG: adenosine-specific kinase [Candidatus Omnitrophica bacterium]|nr:adenosine-specific kinase [Candidatus Omnitrophota bacterium]MBU2044194.1 adenosine-specific kinase [Candidatus Omnitrophota bacterium]MBU2250674.1 adenosine-specific kinase [Candidatus Omnitrophota bacterium]MBU2265980.1 adenosine-specific kinase [Candidatus Omnitrophota bacterium]MBU2473278.1 adenosine-specific kinase [Candidatus Omnitrophota bacterium]
MEIGLELIKIEKPQDLNVIIGHSHFVKTVEDVYEALVGSMPNIRFGLAFSEASGKCLVRIEGNDPDLIEIAASNVLRIGCGHLFFVALKESYPINVLNQIKNVPEVCRIFCASANPLEVIVAKTEQGKAILGVVDGFSPKGIEGKEDSQERKLFLRKFGYKL